MRKLIALFLLAAVGASAQVTNTVNISNSLLGPITNIFTNVTIDATGEIVITGAVFNTSVTNSFAPVNNVTSVVNVGETTVINSNVFTTILTNVVDVQVAGVVVTNNFSIAGDLSQTFVTNFFDQFTGVNVFTPNLTDTNVSGTWTIALDTNAAVRRFIQTGNITSVVFSVDDTNDVALAEIILAGTTNSITWPTNKLVWAAVAAPTHTTNENIFYFRAWREYIQGVYVDGSTQ
jgi:hypothetical protein